MADFDEEDYEDDDFNEAIVDIEKREEDEEELEDLD